MRAPEAATGAIMARAGEVLPGGVLGRHRYPPGLEHVHATGQGARITDVQGRSYIDYSLGGGSLVVGYSHPEVVRAICEQAARGTQFVSIVNDRAVELAEAIKQVVPWIDQLRFGLSGSEAIMYALRLARAFTGRDKILRFEGAYHGNSDYALIGNNGREGGSSVGLFDSAGIPRVARDLVLVCPYNDPDAFTHVAEANWRDIAAVIVEPVQRTYRAEPAFLDRLRGVCHRHGIVLVFDEVVTGFRHALGGAQAAFGITPDLSVFGKALGGGLPMSAVAGRRDILSYADPGRGGVENGYCYVTSSQAGYPLGCAAALAGLRILSGPDVLSRMHASAEALKAGLRDIIRRRRLDAIVVGHGPLWDLAFGVDEVRDHASAQRADKKRHLAFHMGLVRHGVMVRVGGRSYYSIAHGPAEVDITLRAAEAALNDMGMQ